MSNINESRNTAVHRADQAAPGAGVAVAAALIYVGDAIREVDALSANAERVLEQIALNLGDIGSAVNSLPLGSD
jgi:hypothetical protein